MTWYFIEADEDTISICDVVADVEVAWESFGNSWVRADSLAKACLPFFAQFGVSLLKDGLRCFSFWKKH